MADQIEATPLRPVPMAILLRLAREGNLAYDDAALGRMSVLASAAGVSDATSFATSGAVSGATSSVTSVDALGSLGQTLLQRSLSQESTQSSPSEPSAQSPWTWTRYADELGRTYYVHRNTGEAVWEIPDDNCDEVWEECADELGRTFYYNAKVPSSHRPTTSTTTTNTVPPELRTQTT